MATKTALRKCAQQKQPAKQRSGTQNAPRGLVVEKAKTRSTKVGNEWALADIELREAVAALEDAETRMAEAYIHA